MQIGSGTVDYINSSENGEDTINSYHYYNYHFNDIIAIEVGGLLGIDLEEENCYSGKRYRKRDSKDWDDWDDWGDSDDSTYCYTSQSSMFDINADSFEYVALAVALKVNVNVSERNELYTKLGVSQYYYSINRNSLTLVDEAGVGGLAELGWRYTWDFGLGLNAGIQYWYMGDFEIDTVTLGVSYNF